MIRWLCENHQSAGLTIGPNLISFNVVLLPCFKQAFKSRKTTDPASSRNSRLQNTHPISAPSNASLIGINEPLLLAWRTFFSPETRTNIMAAFMDHLGHSRGSLRNLDERLALGGHVIDKTKMGLVSLTCRYPKGSYRLEARMNIW